MNMDHIHWSNFKIMILNILNKIERVFQRNHYKLREIKLQQTAAVTISDTAEFNI